MCQSRSTEDYLAFDVCQVGWLSDAVFSSPPYFPDAHIFKKQEHESEDNHLVHLLFHFSSQQNVEKTSQKITQIFFVFLPLKCQSFF